MKPGLLWETLTRTKNPNLASMNDFNECILEVGLLEINDPQDYFNWEREGLREKIDWVFCNIEWMNSFPHTNVLLDLQYKSDHKVMAISCFNSPVNQHVKKRFHYQTAWVLEESFLEVVEQAWQDHDWSQGVGKFREIAEIWNRDKLGNTSRRKKEIMRRLEGIKRRQEQNDNHGLNRLERRLWADYNKLLLQEELNWFQKSRCQWLQWRDRSTKFFHVTAVIKQENTENRSS